MSAKGRGAPVVDSEFYPTPSWCARRILEELDNAPWLPHSPGAKWLEPCAGDGAIVRVVRDRFPHVNLTMGDIRACDPVGGAQALGWTDFRMWCDFYDVVITNPPFEPAADLIQHFLPRCSWLILLLRSSFKLVKGDEEKGTRVDFRNNMPDEYKLPQRPSFIRSEKCIEPCAPPFEHRKGCGWALKSPLEVSRSLVCPRCAGKVQASESDNSEYSWFVWTPTRSRKFGRTRVLPDTPLEERKAR